MSRPELAPELRRFVVTNVPSVPYLEAILLLRAQPQRYWTAADMARRLYVSESAAASLLDAAVAAGVAATAPVAQAGVGYQPSSPELADLLDRLATHYAHDVVTVATLIHKQSDTRVRRFADAFVWRKES